MRRRYLFCYDIRDSRRLRQTHRIAREHGDALQYSVFICDLSAAERIQMMDAFRDVLDQTVDSIAVFDLGATQTDEKAQVVDRLGPQPPLPHGGPTVV